MSDRATSTYVCALREMRIMEEMCDGYPFDSCIRTDAKFVFSGFILCRECKDKLDKDIKEMFMSLRYRR